MSQPPQQQQQQPLQVNSASPASTLRSDYETADDVGRILDLVQDVLDRDPIALAPTPINPSGVHVVDTVRVSDASWYDQHEDVDSFRACLQSLLPPVPPPPTSAYYRTMDTTNKHHQQKQKKSVGAATAATTIHKARPSSLNKAAKMKIYKQNGGSSNATTNAIASSSTPTISTTLSSVQQQQRQLDHNGVGGNIQNRFRPYQSEQWSARYQDLIEFRKERGHCLVPHKWKGNPELAQWVKRQRYQYKLKMQGRHSTLTDERLKCLNNMGFVWDSHKATWDERYNELVAFRKIHGHTNVPSGDSVYPQLSVWVKCQRRQYRLFYDTNLEERMKSTMTIERIQQLDSIGFIWSPRKK